MSTTILPNLISSQGGPIQFCRYVDDSDAALDLEERALTNYLNEVTNVHSTNFVYNPNIHPTHINMFRNPNHYIGEAARTQMQ